MKRRDFLKLIGVASIAPSVLAAMPKEPETFTGVDWTFTTDLTSWSVVCYAVSPDGTYKKVDEWEYPE